MFFLNISRSGFTSLIRSYHRSVKIEPGIRGRRKMLGTEDESNEDFDDLESDFMNVHQSHIEYENDLVKEKERLKHSIIKQKYFKRKFPNFLTWHDKEQIKYLHNNDPEEWTIEKLSESFPALPEVIKKVLSAIYRKMEHKILNHDIAVCKNWELFKSGQMQDLPEELTEHLKKFTNRSLNVKPLEFISNKTEVLNVNRNLGQSEFSEIITSYEKLKNKNKTNKKIEVNLSPNAIIRKDKKNPDSGFLGKVSKANPTTLEELQRNVENKALEGKKLQEQEKLLLKHTEQSKENMEIIPQTINLKTLKGNKYTSSGSLMKKNIQDCSHLLYPERIRIPKNIWKRDHIYKLNDCYYNSDGSFLYRVPGMG